MTFTLYENLKDCFDSMCFDSGTVIATYEEYGRKVVIEVQGHVLVYFKGERYFHWSDFPEELQGIFKNGTAYEDEQVVIQNNNWFDIFLIEDENNDDVYERDLSKITEQDLKQDMQEWLDYFLIRQRQ